jgi:hypothetical protein
MINQINFKPSLYKKRWVSYLDLLGFTNTVLSKNWTQVFATYTQAVEKFIADKSYNPGIGKTWFSDTFLSYTEDDSAKSFAGIEGVTRRFIYYLISSGIPIRGSISCGGLYVDKDNNIFFGEALIESYQYGENQDWLGLVLSPSAVKQMKEVGLPADERLNYAFWNIPKKHDDTNDKKLPAYIIGREFIINGRNICLDKLKEMKANINDENISRKYENTINFIKSNRRITIEHL